MRIAFLSQLLPLPLDAGPKVRAYYVLRHLADAGHDVTLVCFVRPADRQSDIDALRRFCTSVETVPMSRSRLRDVRDGVQSLVSAKPFLILRDRIPAMSERLERMAAGRSFDAVHADQLWMASYAAAFPGAALKVLDQHNAVFRVPDRMADNQSNPVLKYLLRREASKLAAYERNTVEQFDQVVWVNEDDRDLLVRRDTHTRARQVIPIAVDPGAYRPVERPRPFRVTFLAGLHWPPNAEGARWFLDSVWPRVANAVPGAVFTVIGKRARGGLVTTTPRVETTGYVADLQPYLAETAVFVVPLLAGAGMRVKILDAWCWQLPVVSTRVGAEGIHAVHGENILLADEADAFADALISVLNDRGLADRVARHGRDTVEARYDWRTTYAAWDAVYQ